MIEAKKMFGYSLAAIAAPLLLLSFGSHTFWHYVHETRRVFGLADSVYIHPLIAALGLIATVMVLVGLYQRLPGQTRPTSSRLLGLGIVGFFLGLLGLSGFLWTVPGWLFAGIGGGFLLPLISLLGLGYYGFVHRVLGAFSFAPLAVAITTITVFLTADYAAGIDKPIGQVFVMIHIICWLLLGVGLLNATGADNDHPVPV